MSNNKAEQIRRRKQKLFEQNPYCPHCGTLMELQEPGINKTNDKTAVLQHTVTKIDTSGVPQTILCCLGCSNRLAKEKQARLGLEELRLRASKQGMCTCECGNRHIKSVKS